MPSVGAIHLRSRGSHDLMIDLAPHATSTPNAPVWTPFNAAHHQQEQRLSLLLDTGSHLTILPPSESGALQDVAPHHQGVIGISGGRTVTQSKGKLHIIINREPDYPTNAYFGYVLAPGVHGEATTTTQGSATAELVPPQHAALEATACAARADRPPQYRTARRNEGSLATPAPTVRAALEDIAVLPRTGDTSTAIRPITLIGATTDSDNTGTAGTLTALQLANDARIVDTLEAPGPTSSVVQTDSGPATGVNIADMLVKLGPVAPESLGDTKLIIGSDTAGLIATNGFVGAIKHNTALMTHHTAMRQASQPHHLRGECVPGIGFGEASQQARPHARWPTNRPQAPRVREGAGGGERGGNAHQLLADVVFDLHRRTTPGRRIENDRFDELVKTPESGGDRGGARTPTHRRGIRPELPLDAGPDHPRADKVAACPSGICDRDDV